MSSGLISEQMNIAFAVNIIMGPCSLGNISRFFWLILIYNSDRILSIKITLEQKKASRVK